MTSKERLRALLDERGIEYTICMPWNETAWEHDGTHFTATERFGKIYLQTSQGPMTPEQAIAATVGTEPDEANVLQAKVKTQSDYINKLRGEYKVLEAQMERRCAEYRNDIRRLKAELDAATVGAGTCQIETTESWLPAEQYHRCKRCGAFFAVLDASHDIPPRVCPNCGRQIVKEATE